MSDEFEDLGLEELEGIVDEEMEEAQKPTTAVSVEEVEELTPDEAVEKANLLKEKNRIAQILERGLVTDMLDVRGGDPNRRYAYIRERDIDQEKYKMLGYRLESRSDLAKESVHGTGDDRIKVGDVVLMSVDRERYDLIELVKAERRARRMGSPVREYESKARREAAAGGAQPLDLSDPKKEW